MNDPIIEERALKDAIEMQHGGVAFLVQSVPVKETFESQTVWKASSMCST